MNNRLLILTLFGLLNQAVAQVPWLNRETITGAHDPSIIKDDRGVYTLMTTNNLLQVRQSDNLMSFRSVGNVVSRVPAYMGSGPDDLWAPHIGYMNGRYWAYYCGSSFGTNNSFIGVASTPTLNTTAADYRWTDHGEVIRTTSGNNYNAIDPELFIDPSGKAWMSFGSWWTGIKMIAIDVNTGKQSTSDRTLYSLSNRGGSGIEGPSIIENNGYFYLFTAWDVCCNGVSSTYRTMMGRAQSVTGPYTDRAGRALNSSGGTQVLGRYGRYVGPGGGSAFKDGRRSYFVHHYYNASSNGQPTLGVREIVYDSDNWAIITQPFLGRRLAFEAEHAQLTNADIVNSSQASGAEYAGGIDAADSRVVFHINALQAGTYNIRIRFAAPSGAASHFVKVNAAAETEVAYPASPSSVDFPDSRVATRTITLTEGYNNITFRKGTGVAHLDRFDLIKLAKNTIQAGSFDQSKVVAYVASGNNASFSANDWAQFEYIDFEQGGSDRLLVSSYGSCAGGLRLNLDGPTGATTATVNLALNAATQNYTATLPAAIAAVRGVHDVYLTYTGSGTCSLDNFRFANSTIAAIDDISELNGTSVYPNPFNDSFEILSEGAVSYEVLNILGQVVASGESSGLATVGNLPAKGTYFVRITKNGNSVLKKIIKH